ncbi:MAG: HPr family phosphocarrier protein [Acidobacteria bacterium]|nr:HPr family phosphocarrier protein [Acidobacteriota bacterium]MCG2815446.1 HPr family phosphocarrier protein [Candidatus Aminicenantes bacterium]MBU1337670.1 HPr family phosphocarrier protein [Acidobacteriota bacterium]MBU1475593.1 HPr family phosphocarrier protein [Acidobacteriota bacterium]MBU2437737.1 HPr family phosphocarrier protein [Acidobacteriota bacterium]
MIEYKILIKNRLGLHARAAVKFVNTANRFQSSVRIRKNDDETDGKSILGILTLAAVQGTEILLIISGFDEKAALKELKALINGKFGEEE